MYYFPELREEMELANFEPDQPIEHDYLVATFHGNTSQVVGLYYHPRFCLRVLDPDLDPLNPLLPEAVRKAADIVLHAVDHCRAAGRSRPPAGSHLRR